MHKQEKTLHNQSFKSIHEAFAWLEKNAPSHLITQDLEKVSLVAQLLALLNLSKTCKIITVAGSNGKGTTCLFAESIALEHGEKVGLYTSPHLVSFNERIRINGDNIDDEALLFAFNRILACCLDNGIRLSYFEFTTLCALWCFRQEQCTLIILEVGLGGRLDATNMIDNHCAIITSISLEHKQWLGDTLEAIAREKSSIIRVNKPVIFMNGLHQECAKMASEKNAHALTYGQDFTIEEDENEYIYCLHNNSSQQQFRFNKAEILCVDSNFNKNSRYSQEYCVLRVKNLALSLSALLSIGIKLNSSAINKALIRVKIPGRLESFTCGNLTGWLDVAHNPEAVTNLAKFLSFLPAKVNAVFSCLNDKEINEIISIINPYIDKWSIIEMSNPRAIKIEKIADALSIAGVSSDSIHCYKENNLMNDLNNCPSFYDNKVIVFGSFVLVGLMKNMMNKSRR